MTIYDLVSLQVVKHGIYAVINLVTSTTGSRRVIIRDNVLAVNKVLSLIRCIKSMWPKAIFIQLGSITELSYNSGSIYSKAKKEVRKIIQDSSMCDFHLVFGFTYGENPRMISDLRKILPFCYKYKSLLHGFRMACIHVEVMSLKAILATMELLHKEVSFFFTKNKKGIKNTLIKNWGENNEP